MKASEASWRLLFITEAIRAFSLECFHLQRRRRSSSDFSGIMTKYGNVDDGENFPHFSPIREKRSRRFEMLR